eukprot:1188520-Prorocentrum_minimum.AAC.1
MRGCAWAPPLPVVVCSPPAGLSAEARVGGGPLEVPLEGVRLEEGLQHQQAGRGLLATWRRRSEPTLALARAAVLLGPFRPLAVAAILAGRCGGFVSVMEGFGTGGGSVRSGEDGGGGRGGGALLGLPEDVLRGFVGGGVAMRGGAGLAAAFSGP